MLHNSGNLNIFIIMNHHHLSPLLTKILKNLINPNISFGSKHNKNTQSITRNFVHKVHNHSCNWLHLPIWHFFFVETFTGDSCFVLSRVPIDLHNYQKSIPIRPETMEHFHPVKSRETFKALRSLSTNHILLQSNTVPHLA